MSISYLDRLKTFLRQDNVKLWEAPHSDPHSLDPLPFSEAFVSTYASKLGLSSPETSALLGEVRGSAVERLRARRRFEETGLARLYLHVASGAAATGAHVDIRLSATGAELATAVGSALSLDPSGLRLIVGGRVVEAGRGLEAAGIGSGAEVLVAEEEAGSAEASWLEEVGRARAAAARLSASEGGERSLEIRDQNGERLRLPREESESLTVAMTLQEKGHAAVVARRFTRALLFLLEADKEFRACRSELLQAVDNFALLNLDIVWCYLKINSVRNLPDAESRLSECETCFNKSYGVNLERVARIKASVELEKGLVLRLRLMQGILAFHKGEFPKARRLFADVQDSLKAMEVDPEKLNQLMLMGYEESESRLALRSAQGSVELAVQRILQKREPTALKESLTRESAERSERRQRRLESRLGTGVDGRQIPVAAYEQLLAMGYPEPVALLGLRAANGDLNVAIERISAGGLDSPALAQLAAALEAAPRPRRRSSGGETAEEAAVRELEGDVGSSTAEAHLDLTFQEEADLLAHFTQLLTTHL